MWGREEELRNILLLSPLEQTRCKLQTKESRESLRIPKELKVGAKPMIRLGREKFQCIREEITRKKQLRLLRKQIPSGATEVS